jgi:hypothetical protein
MLMEKYMSESINRVTAYPNGVGVFNKHEQMVGWIASTDAEVIPESAGCPANNIVTH